MIDYERMEPRWNAKRAFRKFLRRETEINNAAAELLVERAD